MSLGLATSPGYAGGNAPSGNTGVGDIGAWQGYAGAGAEGEQAQKPGLRRSDLSTRDGTMGWCVLFSLHFFVFFLVVWAWGLMWFPPLARRDSGVRTLSPAAGVAQDTVCGIFWRRRVHGRRRAVVNSGRVWAAHTRVSAQIITRDQIRIMLTAMVKVARLSCFLAFAHPPALLFFLFAAAAGSASAHIGRLFGAYVCPIVLGGSLVHSLSRHPNLGTLS
ncbi:hypothetical protein C8F04DRAFT_1267853 [Mycena alexandri]|uniref:Uncharacterized protein n=1 Tax=Mycena alexandri TaxID=1745969 RepID=A0AAD6WTJ6_9AGAR|nr:hypothetical protein C8F04DRAFT_1267853 [Mycena alexandri]